MSEEEYSEDTISEGVDTHDSDSSSSRGSTDYTKRKSLLSFLKLLPRTGSNGLSDSFGVERDFLDGKEKGVGSGSKMHLYASQIICVLQFVGSMIALLDKGGILQHEREREGVEAIQCVLAFSADVLEHLGTHSGQSPFMMLANSCKYTVKGMVDSLKNSTEVQDVKELVDRTSADMQEFLHVPEKIQHLVTTLLKNNYEQLMNQDTLSPLMTDKGTSLKKMVHLLKVLSKSRTWSGLVQRTWQVLFRPGSELHTLAMNVLNEAKSQAFSTVAGMEPAVNQYATELFNKLITGNILNVRAVHKLILLALNNPKLIEDPELRQECGALYKKAEALVNRFVVDKTEEKVLSVDLSPRSLLESISDFKSISDDFKTLMGSMGASANTWVQEVKDNLATILLDKLSTIIIPEIDKTIQTPLGKFRCIVSGISLVGLHIKPKYINFEMYHKTGWSSPRHTYFIINIEHVQVHFKAVSWKWKRTTRPKLSDSGLVDIDTSKKGIQMGMRFQADDIDERREINEASASAKIDKLKIKIGDSKHDVLYSVITAVFSNIIKKQVELALQEELLSLQKKFNDKFVDMLVFMKNKCKSQT